jgi:hypothetical protein
MPREQRRLGPRKIISLIGDALVIEKILRHLTVAANIPGMKQRRPQMPMDRRDKLPSSGARLVDPPAVARRAYPSTDSDKMQCRLRRPRLNLRRMIHRNRAPRRGF